MVINLAVTLLDEDITLLSHFIRWYDQRGVDFFYIRIHRGQNNSAWQRLFDHLPGGFPLKRVKLSGSIKDRVEDDYTALDAMFQDSIRQSTPKDNWLVVADLDEFHEPPGNVSFTKLANLVADAGCHYVMSNLSDRMMANGQLERVPDEGDLLKLFPRIIPESSDVLQCLRDKVSLYSPRVPVEIGHHGVSHPDFIPYPERGVTHHFKWHGEDLKARLEFRLKNVLHLRPWVAREYHKAIQAIHDGKLHVDS